uniref:Uncharacterized protein n=1 Tax=Setaria viridis TaxID=4556 RepID=A0A4V6DAJ6_SETVI|nr:hypothetical protein SEVIR_2G000475v2 [Setaria viridis]
MRCQQRPSPEPGGCRFTKLARPLLGLNRRAAAAGVLRWAASGGDCRGQQPRGSAGSGGRRGAPPPRLLQ